MPSSEAGRARGFLSRDFILLFTAHFIVVGVYFLFIATMARHAMEAFACSDSMAGLVASIFMVGAALTRILSGRFVDPLGLKRCSVASLLLMLATCLLYPIADTNLPLMLVVRFVHGVSFGIATTAMPAIAAEIIPLEVMAEGTGWFMLSNSLGVGIGPLFGLLVSGSFDYTALYWGCSILTVIALAAVIPLAAGRVPEGGSKRAIAALPPFKPNLIFDPATRKFSFYIFIIGFAYSSINAFVDPYSASIGLAGWAASVFLVYSVALVIVRPIFGRLQDRRGENAVLYPSFLSMAVGMLVCASCSFVPSPIPLILVGVFAATGFGTSLSAGVAVINKLSQGSKAAPGIATFYLLCDFGIGIGPFLLGFIVGAFGYVALYVACCGIALLGLVYYHFAHGRNVRNN